MILSYREDIDWLRAIAVLSVLAFHFELAAFVGGYVGVDIFFVISGYLITRIIHAEMLAGDFSFAQFYERRIRRLLPALYVMIALTALPSFYFLFPSERNEFFRSAAASVAFVSNIFFWSQTGYFARAASDKPLLHTWSLSVEEQFYLVLPLLVWALVRWQRNNARSNGVLYVGIGAAALASFALAVFLMKSDRIASAFFLSPPRAWEFLVGSLIALPGMPGARNIHIYRAMRWTGFALIATAVFAYRKVSFPGVTALLPCAGAALFIWAGHGRVTLARAWWSPFRVVNFFGRISYSLYLWHWPVFIYAKFSKLDLRLGPVEKTPLFALTVALAYLSYRYVEQPVRKSEFFQNRRSVFAVAGLSSVGLLLACLIGTAGLGTIAPQGDRVANLESYIEYQPPFRSEQCFMHDWANFDYKTCLTMNANKTNVLLWGDSLASHYFYGLNATVDTQRVAVLETTAESCLPTFNALPVESRCNDMAKAVGAFLSDHRPSMVILSADWLTYSTRMQFDGMIAEIERLLAVLKSKNIPVVLVGPTIEFRNALPWMVMRIEARKLDPASVGDLLVPNIFTLDDRMKAALSGRGGVSYLSLLDQICPEHKCPLTVANDVPLTFDHAHLTREGSAYIATYIAKAAQLPLAALASK